MGVKTTFDKGGGEKTPQEDLEEKLCRSSNGNKLSDRTCSVDEKFYDVVGLQMVRNI